MEWFIIGCLGVILLVAWAAPTWGCWPEKAPLYNKCK